MSAFSLEGSIRTCKVSEAWAPRVQSDRFQNPDLLVCPLWNGRDTAGREVCPDSFYTKRAGCNSAEDRVLVENYQRPQYAEYVNLSASGIAGHIFGDSMNQFLTNERTAELGNVNDITGNFGMQFGADVIPSCPMRPMRYAQAQMAQGGRQLQSMENGYYSNAMRGASGF